jgi:hypothetical protein
MLHFILATYREVTEEGRAIVSDSVIAMRGWLHHVPGLGRPAYGHEEVRNGVAGQIHLSDGCHRKSFIDSMYITLFLTLYCLCLHIC